MSEEILTGAALHRAIADAMDASEGPEVFETFNNADWWAADQWLDLAIAESDGYKVRRKPRTRHLIDANGKRWEWPEPLQFAPRIQSTYYFVSLSKESGVDIASWENTAGNHAHLIKNIAHKSCNDCRKHARALIAASGGEVSDE